MEVKRASHTSYQIRYHQVYCVKYRKKLLQNEEYRDTLKEIIRGICERYGFEIDEIGTDGDHVHLFVGTAPRIAPSKIMQIIKSISAREMFKKFPDVKKQLRGGEFWSDGGYIGTVGEGTNEEIVRKYIQNQADETEHELYKQLRLFRLRE